MPKPGVGDRIAAAILGSLVLAACAETGEFGVHAEWAVEQEERGDTTVVRTVDGSVWGDSATLSPELAVGELDGEDAYLFGQVTGLEVTEDGRVVLVDQQARRVRIFAPDGTHERSFGQAGEGPGEFSRPDHARVMPDGRILVRDAPSRFSLFSFGGEYLGGWPLQAGFFTNSPFFVDPEGRILNPTLSDRLVWYGPDGEPLDTIPPPSRGFTAPRLEVQMGGGRATYSIPFTPGERWTLTPEGEILFGRSDTYAIERWGEHEVLRIERVAEPAPVLPDEARQLRDRLTATIRGANDPEWRWQGPNIPEVKPVFQSLVAGRDGSIWVFRHTRAAEEPNPAWDPNVPDEATRTVWVERRVADVFDREGRYLGPVRVPRGVALNPAPVVTTDYVWAVTVADLGLLQWVRYRVEVPGR